MNICILSGSARENNNTIRVALAIRNILSEKGHQVTVVDFKAYDIPFINQQKIDPAHLSPFQQQLVNGMNEAEQIVVISPEYNWSTTPEILNFLHRFGDKAFKHLFDNKVFAMVGVSTGKGGKTPALHITAILHKIISFLNLQSIVSPKIFESHFTKEVIDEQGNLTGNEAFNNGLNDFVSYTEMMTRRWHQKH